MLYLNAECNDAPEEVTVEHLPGGRMHIRMTDNVREVEGEDGRFYRYDEVDFFLPDGATEEDIDADFDKWWEYGKVYRDTPEPAPQPMTMGQMEAALKRMQEQNEMLEECLLEMSEVLYA